jgi:hypothetical protein
MEILELMRHQNSCFFCKEARNTFMEDSLAHVNVHCAGGRGLAKEGNGGEVLRGWRRY